MKTDPGLDVAAVTGQYFLDFRRVFDPVLNMDAYNDMCAVFHRLSPFAVSLPPLRLPVNAFDQAHVNCFRLDHLFRCAAGVIAFGFPVVRHAEHPRDVVCTEPATDTLVLINPWCLCHFSSFSCRCEIPPRESALLNVLINHEIRFRLCCYCLLHGGILLD
jgi:hypothetical protein